jgi:hypothetical protein
MGGRPIWGLGLLSCKPDSSINFVLAIVVGEIRYLISWAATVHEICLEISIVAIHTVKDWDRSRIPSSCFHHLFLGHVVKFLSNSQSRGPLNHRPILHSFHSRNLPISSHQCPPHGENSRTTGWMSYSVLRPKPSTPSMCAQESSLHTYHTENGYKITNVSV